MKAVADNPTGDPQGQAALEGFHAQGGYALLLQGWGGTQFGSGLLTAQPNNTPIGGVEVIRYSGKTGNELIVSARGVQNEIDATFLDGPHAFILDYGGALDVNGNDVALQMDRSLYCIPISIPVSNAGIFPESNGAARFAQITHSDAGERTEWVRYDQVQTGFQQLVRIDPIMVQLLGALLGTGRLQQVQSQVPGGGGGGGGGGGSGPLPPPAVSPSPAPVASAPQVGQGFANTWTSVLGSPGQGDYPLTDAVQDIMRFRGVADTQAQMHNAGTLVVPVFEVEGGYGQLPGAGDAVFLDGGAAQGSSVQASVVQRAFVSPNRHVQRTYQHQLVAEAARAGTELLANYPAGEIGSYVALASGLPVGVSLSNAPLPGEDIRLLPRIVKFPSGERPRGIDQMAFGTSVASSSSSAAGAAIVLDEVVFDTMEQGSGLVAGFQPGSNAGAGLVLALDMGERDAQLLVHPGLFAARGQVPGTFATMALLPGASGLGRIGDEIVCYTERDANTGTVNLAPGGRGLLGTEPAPHCAETVLYPMPDWSATVLVQDAAAEDEFLAVWSTADFPDQGTVLVDGELLHYTRKDGNVLWMPRGSLQPGARDGGGPALFRGRFGTTASAHSAGAAVILFPFRYWDRWQDRCDEPEMGYLGLRVDQSAALFDQGFFQEEPNSLPGVSLEAILRGDPSLPWDADPEETAGLFHWDKGKPSQGDTWPIGVWSDSLEARFYVRYQPGAVDLLTGTSHSWKYAPRLRQFGVSFDAPSETLRSVDR